MAEYFEKWKFKVEWMHCCETVVVWLNDEDVDLERLHFDSGNVAKDFLQEHDVYLGWFDRDGLIVPVKTLVEYNEKLNLYELRSGGRACAMLKLCQCEPIFW